jgi:hypothetical protein
MKDIQRANPTLSSRENQDLLEVEKQQASDNRYAQHFAPTAADPNIGRAVAASARRWASNRSPADQVLRWLWQRADYGIDPLSQPKIDVVGEVNS